MHRRRRSRKQERGGTGVLDAEHQNRNRPPPRLRQLLQEHPAFQILSVDGLSWIDPFTGSLISAPFDYRESAWNWLCEHKPWKKQPEPMPLNELQILRWRYFLKDGLKEDKRLRFILPDRRWLNPFNGKWVSNLELEDGRITRSTVRQMANLLAACPEAAAGRLMDRPLLEHIYQDARQKLTRVKTQGPDDSSAHMVPIAQATPQAGPTDISGRLGAVTSKAAGNDRELIAGYRVVNRLGQGGMGVIYKAEQLSMQRMVALKVLRDVDPGDYGFKERFLREARIAGSINHPHVVTVFDVGEHQGKLYMSMELLETGDAVQLANLHGGHLDESHALRLAAEVCDGLQALHDAGLIHRDVKPTNIFVGSDGHAKVGDLGLAKNLAADGQMTMGKIAIGTPCFMAPEQADENIEVDHRCDLYGLGVSLFALLTGHPPYEGSNPFTILRQVLYSDIPDIRDTRPDISAQTAEIICRCMAKDPSDRFASATDLAIALRQVQTQQGPQEVEQTISMDLSNMEIDLDSDSQVELPETARYGQVTFITGRHHAGIDGSGFIEEVQAAGQTIDICGHIDADPDTRAKVSTLIQGLLPRCGSIIDLVRSLQTELPADVTIHLQALVRSPGRSTIALYQFGVEPAWLCQPKQEQVLSQVGKDLPPIQANTATDTEPTDIELPEGASLLLASPGAIDAQDGAGRPYGHRHLGAQLLIHSDLPAVRLARRLGEELDHYARGHLIEDASLIIMQRPRESARHSKPS